MIEKLKPASIDFSMIVRQLEKDFSLSGWSFPDQLKQNSINKLWLESLAQVLRQGFYQEKSKLFQLLYRIDIEEKELIMTTLMENEESHLERTFLNLAQLVFFREQMKVQYRLNNK